MMAMITGTDLNPSVNVSRIGAAKLSGEVPSQCYVRIFMVMMIVINCNRSQEKYGIKSDHQN